MEADQREVAVGMQVRDGGAQADVVALKVVESGQILNMKLFLTLNIF